MTTETTASGRVPEDAEPPEISRRGGGQRPRLVRQLGRMLAGLCVLVVAGFVMAHAAPGDPVRNVLGMQADQEVVEAKREALGLNDPLPVQFRNYVGGLMRGDLGASLSSDEPVSSVLARLAPATMQLVVPAFALSMLVALLAGMSVAALTRNGRKPRVNAVFAIISGFFSTVPEYVLGVLLVFVFGVTLNWLPVAQMGGTESHVLPVISLAVAPAAMLSRVVRVEATRVFEAEYMRTAESKRLPWHLFYLRHALPNLLTASLTVGGIILIAMASGTVLVESVFAWPGLGSELVRSILEKDLPVIQGMLLVFGAFVLVINLVIDLVIAAVDTQFGEKE